MMEANRDQPDDKAIVFRIGLHLGDVIVEGDDIYGDDVNVAARLEAEASPGSIVVSRAVRDAVQGRLKVNLHALGELALKNIDRPIRAFRVEWSAQDWPTADEAASPPFSAPPGSASAWPTPADKGTIAVLPFKNLTGDPEHEYFVDGLVEDITRALSRISWLFVIPCGSSFAYKGSAVDARKVGRELGVRYVLVGSIRKASNRLRISGEVIDVVTGGHIWADRFEGALEDVFDLQDKITSSVIPAIVPQVLYVEIARAQAKPTTNLTAYDHYLRALALVFEQKAEAFRQALSFLYKAIEIDPKFSSAHALIADCYLNLFLQTGLVVGNERALGMEAARRAIETGHDNPDALARAGMCIAVLGERQLEGLQHVERALALNPKTLAILRFAAFVYNLVGDHPKALALYERSLHFGVLDKDAWGSYNGIALVHFFAGHFGEAVHWADKAFAARPELGVVGVLKIAAMAAADKPANEVQQFLREWLGTRSPPPIRAVRERMSAFRPIDVKSFVEALRKAGLPE
jgi:TolB-like protein